MQEGWRQAGAASDAGQPHELTALRARIRHPQVAFERDEPAACLCRARRTNRRRSGFDRGDAQLPAGDRTRHSPGASFVSGDVGLSVVAGMPPKQAVIQISPSQRLLMPGI